MDILTRSYIAEKLANHSDRNARATCAAFTWISQELLERLSEDKWSIVRLCTAMNRFTPKQILEKLTGDVAPHVREASRLTLDFLTRPETPYVPDVSEYNVPIGLSDELGQQFKLARQSDLSQSEIRELLSSRSEWVRTNLAFPYFAFATKLTEPKALRLDPESLVKLANDESGLVRAALARNPLVPKEILESLAGDTDSRVIDMLASNPSTPKEILISMLETDNWRVWVSLTNNAAIEN